MSSSAQPCTGPLLQQKLENSCKAVMQHESIWKVNWRSLAAAFLWMAESVPLVAASASVAIYLLFPKWPNYIPPIGGTAGALFCFLLLSHIISKFIDAAHVDINSYQRLINRLYQVVAWVNGFQSIQDAKGNKVTADNCLCKDIPNMFNKLYDPSYLPEPVLPSETMTVISLHEIAIFFCAICEKLKQKGVIWISEFGYLDVWRLMHRIDEAFTAIEPLDEVIYDAIHDLKSIQDSKIEDQEALVYKLLQAINQLDPNAAKLYLNTEPKQQAKLATITYLATNPRSDINPGSPRRVGVLIASHTAPSSVRGTSKQPSQPINAETLARMIICEVRLRLNQFRDDRWEKLMRVRLLMMKMTFWTGLVLYTLVQFALIRGIDETILGNLIVYFLLGGVIGVFSRLYNQSKMDVSLDDYHLADARLISTPLYSGIAAALGVVLFPVVFSFTSGDSQAAAQALQALQAASLPLSERNILIASIFGLVPNLITTAIQTQADQYKSDIKSTIAESRPSKEGRD